MARGRTTQSEAPEGGPLNVPATCGQGVAERAALPARLSALAAVVADNLHRHQQTLDLGDDNARREHQAYDTLVRLIEQKQAASIC
jgi:hypothetical protein